MPAHKGLCYGWGVSNYPQKKYPRRDSNAGSRLRRPVLYPLSYGGAVECKIQSAKFKVICAESLALLNNFGNIDA